MTLLYHRVCLPATNHLFYRNYHFAKKNELKSKDFIKKFHRTANDNFRLAIGWKT